MKTDVREVGFFHIFCDELFSRSCFPGHLALVLNVEDRKCDFVGVSHTCHKSRLRSKDWPGFEQGSAPESQKGSQKGKDMKSLRTQEGRVWHWGLAEKLVVYLRFVPLECWTGVKFSIYRCCPAGMKSQSARSHPIPWVQGESLFPLVLVGWKQPSPAATSDLSLTKEGKAGDHLHPQ